MQKNPPESILLSGGFFVVFAGWVFGMGCQKLPKRVYRVYLDVYLAGAGNGSGGRGVKGGGIFLFWEMSTQAEFFDFPETRKGAWGLGFGGFRWIT